MSTNQERVHALFSVARYLAVEDRKAYLDKECVDDAELREEVESLLKYAPTSAPTRETGTIALGEKDVVDHRYEAGNRIGEYEIKSELGEGGFGIVYFAKQHEPVEREVAIKVLHSNRCTDTFILGFEAERQTLANMSHPGIAHFYDAGLTEHNQPFFVMEFVSGQPITEYCNEHRLSIKQRLALFADVCKAVQHAHNKGVIHRDLTPNNILVSTSEDGSPRAQIIDFGISRKTDEETADVMGTLMYMSPEQATKDASVDTRSDIYTLGVVLYELLVGKPPLDREMFKDAALQAQLKLVKEQDSPTPSTKLSGIGDSDETAAIADQRQENLVSLLKILRRELDWIPRKALQKDPERRYATASEFGEDISRYLNDEAVVAVPDSASYRFKKTANRHKGAFMSAAVVLVVLLAAIVVSAVFWNQAIRERDKAYEASDRAQEAEKKASESSVLATMNRNLMFEQMDEAKKQKEKAERAATLATKNQEEAIEQKRIAEEERKQTIEVKGILLDTLLDLPLTDSGEFNAKSLVEMLDAGIKSLDDGSITALGKAEIQLAFGITYLNIGEIEKAHILLTAAKPELDMADVPELAALCVQYLIMTNAVTKGHKFKNIPNAPDIIELFSPALPTELLTEFRPMLEELGNSLFAAHSRLDEQEKEFVLNTVETLLEEFRIHMGIPLVKIQQLDIASMLQRVAQDAMLHSNSNPFEETLQQASEFYEDAKSRLGSIVDLYVSRIEFEGMTEMSAKSILAILLKLDKHSAAFEVSITTDLFEDTVGFATRHGSDLYLDLKYSDAEEVFSLWLDQSIKTLGEDHAATIKLALWMAQSISKQKNYLEAETVLRKWLAISKNALGEDDETTIGFANWMAHSLFMQENYVEAEEVYRKWLEISKNALGEKNSKTLSLASYYGRSLSMQENYDDAEAVFTEWLEISKNALGEDASKTLVLRKWLGQSLNAQKKYSEAEAVYTELLEINMNTLGEDNATTITWASWMAYSLYMQENYVEAEEVYRKWLEISKNALGEKNSKTLSLASYYGRSLSMQENYDDAEVVFTEWLEISKNALGEDDATTIGFANWMAYSLVMQENYVDAETAYHRWLEISKNALGEKHRTTLSLHNGLDRLKEKQKNTE